MTPLPLRHSALKRLGQSPAHYHAALTAPDAQSRAMEIGNAADRMILQHVTALTSDRQPAQRVLAYPGKVRRGKEWDAFRLAHADALIVTQAEHAVALGMVTALQAHPEALRLLTGDTQRTRVATYAGRLCRATPDCLPDPLTLVDLKTGETSDPRRFPWKVRQFCYHGQIAWYQDILEAAGEPRPTQCYIVAVESKPPHVVTIFRLTEHLLDLGRRQNHAWLETLRACEEANTWPGYTIAPVDLDLAEEGEGGEGITFDEEDADG